MRKIICLLLVFSLFSQPLAIPLSVLAQTPSTPTPTQSGPTSGTTQPPPSPSSSSFSYDSSGNLLSDGERVITWDVEGKPVRIVKGDLETTFLYDSSGGRIGKLVKDKNTGTLQSATLYLGGNLEKELNSDGTTKSTTKYYFAQGKRIAQRKSVNSQQITDNSQPGTTTEELLFIHTDHLSSSTLFTDNQGNKKDSLITYYPYGETRTGWDLPAIALAKAGQSSTITNHLYTDQIKDTETDLYYYNARYYNPTTGMFISADSLPDKFTADNLNNLTGKLNRYSYVKNNPIIFNDPSGHAETLSELSGEISDPPNPVQPPEPDYSLPFSDPVIKNRMEWWFYNIAQTSLALGLDFRKLPPSTPEEKRIMLKGMIESLHRQGINVVDNPLIYGLVMNFLGADEIDYLFHPMSNIIFIKSEKDIEDAELNQAIAALFHETFHYYQSNTSFSPQLGVAYGIPFIKTFKVAYVPGAMELVEAEAYACEIFIIPRLTGEKSELTYEDMKKYIGKDPTSYYWLFSKEAQQQIMREYILPYLYFEY